LTKIVGKNGRVYAVDILPDVIRTIKKQAYTENLLQIKPVWSDLEKFKGTPIDSSSVDAALLVNVLSQSEKKTEIIRESVRLLKHGGRLLIVDWKSDALLFGPPVKYRLRAEALKQIAPKLSLILIEEFEVGIPYHAFLFKKI
jgi:ubiquinone/menaquinone biosynthesis C-methylase UbiE